MAVLGSNGAKKSTRKSFTITKRSLACPPALLLRFLRHLAGHRAHRIFHYGRHTTKSLPMKASDQKLSERGLSATPKAVLFMWDAIFAESESNV